MCVCVSHMFGMSTSHIFLPLKRQYFSLQLTCGYTFQSCSNGTEMSTYFERSCQLYFYFPLSVLKKKKKYNSSHQKLFVKQFSFKKLSLRRKSTSKERKQSKPGQHIAIILSEVRTKHSSGLKNCKYRASDWQFIDRILQVGYLLHSNNYKFRFTDRWIMDRQVIYLCKGKSC